MKAIEIKEELVNMLREHVPENRALNVNTFLGMKKNHLDSLLVRLQGEAPDMSQVPRYPTDYHANMKKHWAQVNTFYGLHMMYNEDPETGEKIPVVMQRVVYESMRKYFIKHT